MRGNLLFVMSAGNLIQKLFRKKELNTSIVKERDKIAKIKIGKLNVCSFVSKYADIVLIAVISKYCGTSNSKKVFIL